MRLFIAFLLTLTLATSVWAQVGVLRNTTITTNGQTVTLKLDPIESLGVSVDNSGTYGLAFEASMDNGVTYFAVGLVDSSDYTVDTTTSGAGKWWFANLGMTHFRVRTTSYTSGTPVVKFVRGYGGVTAPLSAGSVSGANAAAGATGSAVPASASYTGMNIGGTHRGWTGFSVGSQFAGAMAIVDGAGNQITSFGGGTQYAEGATAATITGTALMFESNTGTNTVSVVNNSTPLPVGDAGGSLTVDNGGTFAVQAAQSGTWNVTNVSGTVSLPTGAATSANQSTEITSLQLIDNAVQTVAAGTAGTNSFLVGGVYNSTPITLTTTQGAALQLDANGYLNVNIKAGAGSGGTALADRATFTSGTTNFTPSGGFYESTPTQVTSGQSAAFGMTIGRALKVALSNADGSLASYATDSVFGTTTYTEATTTGPVVGGVRSDALSTKANTTNEATPLQMNSVGALYVQPTAGVSGGADALSYLSVGTTEDKHVVKASAGTLYSVSATNTNAAVRYLKCENDTSANTTVGSETPEFRMAIPGATTGAGFTMNLPVGYAFSNALTCWVVTGVADSDVTEVAANEIILFYTFK